ncbi:MAG: hypothetical protein M1824_001630 [Vezdaea acicularis]|nr:MAG: hypothetical protein M1824_001630 [Vezdaea acicularis]
MAGGKATYRNLSRSSAHRQALLRNLVTSLFIHESISTTWHKAKEAQRLAEKLITLGKKNTEASRRRALQIFYTPHQLLPTLFGPLRERYRDRPGGYTRVLRLEPLDDQAPRALLELVDGPKDMRFLMTAKALSAQSGPEGTGITEMTMQNVGKVTRFREGGVGALEEAVRREGGRWRGRRGRRGNEVVEVDDEEGKEEEEEAVEGRKGKGRKEAAGGEIYKHKRSFWRGLLEKGGVRVD